MQESSLHFFPALIPSHCRWHVLSSVRPQGPLRGEGPKQRGAAGLLTGGASACSARQKTRYTRQANVETRAPRKHSQTKGSCQILTRETDARSGCQWLNMTRSLIQFCPDKSATKPTTAGLEWAWHLDVSRDAAFIIRLGRRAEKCLASPSCVSHSSGKNVIKSGLINHSSVEWASAYWPGVEV